MGGKKNGQKTKKQETQLTQRKSNRGNCQQRQIRAFCAFIHDDAMDMDGKMSKTSSYA